MQQRLILLVLASLLALPAWAACKEAKIPYLPNPNMADIGEMLEAQAAVKNYMQRQQSFLACSRDGVRHNRAVDRMHEVAKEFNKITRRFKAKQQSEDMFTELALISY
ncbi:hypothetical protein NO559_15235 [Dasania sp. GY-MA-18]|uniref:Uncharacterized protein n=1 Tax=Dasania phycosphaerae TaxID=2950436 RepID=A0A9J6RPR8_9GAMM|nr:MULTISPECIES: hypothetical protein [Dasania]MCR8924137.1 hypothetical protein [Dasania sp. GY-MA-18]MCZ0866710.1 hypothetical protein [Dasania phycosphaerae]MCZ0870295.1 hypothetical protein [Dasania phycosphaerae]